MMKENISLKKAAEDLGLFKNVIYKRFYKILNEIDITKYQELTYCIDLINNICNNYLNITGNNC